MRSRPGDDRREAGCQDLLGEVDTTDARNSSELYRSMSSFRFALRRPDDMNIDQAE